MIDFILASGLILYPMNVLIFLWVNDDFRKGRIKDNLFLRNLPKKIDLYGFMRFFQNIITKGGFFMMFIGLFSVIRMMFI